MIELVKYFRILFMSRNLTRQGLKAFTEDHIIRLTNNNPGGIFTAILTAITAAYNSFFGDLADETLNLTVRKSATTAMEESREALLKNISDNEGHVAYVYRNDIPKYELFYPNGITEYSDADLNELATISDRYKEVLSTHAGDFSTQFKDDFDAVQQAYIDNRAAQTGAKEAVTTERGELQITRAGLALQLTKNLLTIALQYVGDETKADTYFNQAILNEAFNKSKKRVENELDPGASEVVFDNITKATVSLMIENNGSEPLHFGFVADEKTPLINDPETAVQPGQEQGTSAGQAGWTSEKKILKVANFTTGTGSYIVRKV
jgi:hypothetical protein